MLGQYYKVGDKTFISPYEGLRESARTGLFAEYILPDSVKQSFLNINPNDLPDNKILIKEKIDFLTDKFNNCRLHYSGGNDSHTILLASSSLKDVYLYLRGLKNPEWIDEEYMFGVRYLKNGKFDYTIKNYSIEHYEVWLDPETPYKYPDFYAGFTPTWYDILEPQEKHSDYFHIHGWDKPFLYAKGDSYYWVILDHQDYLRAYQHCDFYQDHFYPQLAVSQVYSMAKYFKNKNPGLEGWAVYKLGDYKEINFTLGRHVHCDETAQPIKTLQDFKTYGFLNYKQRRSIEEIASLGRTDIIEAYKKTCDQIIQDLKSVQHGINIKSVEAPIIGKIDVPERINRIGAIYKLHNNGLELLPHCDVNLIT